MAETFKLTAEKRESSKHSAREARQARRIPGVLYGHGTESTSISVDYSEFLKLFRKTGQSSVIELDLAGKKHSVLVHVYDLDPVQDTFIHIDLLALDMNASTVAHVPLVFTGESEAVKTLGGIFTPALEGLDIRCLAKDLPHEIKVDISSMKEIHDHILLKDLDLAEGIEIMHLEESVMICSVSLGSQSKTSDEEGEASEETEGDAE